MNTRTERDYEYRRGHIEMLCSHSSFMRCGNCGAKWQGQIRPHSDGQFYRGCWTCHICGANSKGGLSKRAS